LLPSKSFLQGLFWLSENEFSSKKPPCCDLRFCLPPQDGRQQAISFLARTFYGFNFVSVSSNEGRAQRLTKQLAGRVCCSSAHCSMGKGTEDSPRPKDVGSVVLIAPACFHPVPLENSSRLTGFSMSNPLRDANAGRHGL